MRNCRGFTLIELSIVLTIIGIVATLAIPNLLNALDRGRQSSTLSDIRALGTALERYAADHNRYPAAEEISQLKTVLVPAYIKELPIRDGWRHPLVFEVDDQGSTYTLRSPGKDGKFQDEAADMTTHDFSADIVYSDGIFLQRPSGQQDS